MAGAVSPTTTAAAATVAAAAARTCRVAVAQLCSTADIEANFRAVAAVFRESAAKQCSFVALPECFAFLGKGPADALAHAQPLSGPLFARYAALCRQHGLWASFGGFHARPPASAGSEDTRLANTHIVVAPSGKTVATYVKTHLFDVSTADGTFCESAFSRPGNRLTLLNNTPLGQLGLTICYDVRFPAVYDCLRAAGAEAILVPSAFMPSTGEAHWEVLLRARAIETQCFVLAAAQVGQHNETRRSYGHAIIIDPWGKILAKCDGETPGLAIADLDFSALQRVREKMPAASHRRSDLYGAPALHAIDVVNFEEEEQQAEEGHAGS